MYRMSRRPAVTPWYASRYTGLFTQLGAPASRPHDPELSLCAGSAAAWGADAPDVRASGIGWESEAAEAACVGEAVERLQARPLPDDQVVTASHADWPLDEPAL